MDNIMINFILRLMQGFAAVISNPDSPLFYLFVVIVLCGVLKLYRMISH